MNASEGPGNDHGASVEPRLQGSVLARTAFAVVVVDDQSPRLVARLEALRHRGDCVRLRFVCTVLVVERNIHVAAFVVDSSDD